MKPRSTDRTKPFQMVVNVLSVAVVLVVVYWIADFVWSITRLVGW